MKRYRPAGQEFQFPCPVLELAPFGLPDAPGEISLAAAASDSFRAASSSPSLLAHTAGLVGGAIRQVEIWSAPSGFLLKVTGGSDFFLSAHGETIQRLGDDLPWPQLEREILVGPGLALALALRNVWSLHASAVMCNGHAILFLGESGQGKSTLAGYLASALKHVADDILPVTLSADGLTAWPHFPQLKLPLETQPGPSLPEHLPVGHICVLDTADEVSIQSLPPSEATQILLRHTAGTRLFPPELLSRHLTFCAQAAGKIKLSRLSYPRRMDALPSVRAILETIC